MVRRRPIPRRRTLVIGLLSALVALLIASYGLGPIMAVRRYTHPLRSAVDLAPPALAEDAAFTTRDGLTLRGWYIPAQNRAAIILVHGIDANRGQMAGIAEALAAHGYGVLLFDVRAHGASDGDRLVFGADEAEDVLGAVAFLQARPDVDPERIGALGFSLGAGMALLGGARSPALNAIVADGPGFTAEEDFPPPVSWQEWLYVPYDAVFFRALAAQTGVPQPQSLRSAVVAIAPRPVLFICGARSSTECHRVRVFHGLAGEPKALWEIPDAGHIQGFALHPEEYTRRITEFFDRALLRR